LLINKKRRKKDKTLVPPINQPKQRETTENTIKQIWLANTAEQNFNKVITTS